MVRVTHFPALGQMAQLKTFLEAQVGRRKAAGYRTALSRTFLGSDGPEFKLLFMFEDLAGYEAWRGDQDPGVGAQMLPLLARYGHQELSKPLLPTVVGGGGPYAYTVRGEWRPAAGKFPELRDAIVQNVGELQAAGIRANVFVPVAGPPMVVTYRFLATISELDTRPPWTAAQAARFSGHLASPPVTSVNEMLIPW